MRELNIRTRQKSGPKAQAASIDARLQIYAAYGAFLLIATIVFGTLPFRPF